MEPVVNQPPFHLAFPVNDLEASRHFYVDLLDCAVGRESDHWIDFDFFGHQITGHLAPEEARIVATNPVDGKQVPVRHFGVILEWSAWESLSRSGSRRAAWLSCWGRTSGSRARSGNRRPCSCWIPAATGWSSSRLRTRAGSFAR